MLETNFTRIEIEDKLCKLKENDLSKLILVPLFETVFKGAAHFNGGPLEKGKDIIVKKYDELGEIQYIAIQVKKVKISSNTQMSSSLQQLLLQISQASSEKVIDSQTGNAVNVDRLFFVTPHTVPQSALDMHKDALRLVFDENNCRIIDGTKLATLISDHRPDLLNLLFEPAKLVTKSVQNRLRNSELMRALDQNYSKDVAEIHCDISFVFGKAEAGASRHFKIISENDEDTISFKEEQLDMYRELHSTYRNLFNTNLFDLSDLHKPSLTQKEKQLLNNDLKSVIKDIELTHQGIQDIVERMMFSHNTTELLIRAAELKGPEYRSELDSIEKNQNDFTKEQRSQLNIDLKKPRAKIRSLEETKNKLIVSLSANYINIKVNCAELTSNLNSELESFLTSTPSRVEECSELLRRMMPMQDIYEFTTLHREIFQEIDSTIDTNTNRVDINLETVFKTGLNIAVLGDAGSGKTTSLQVYAKELLSQNKNDLAIYVPLVELVNHSKSDPLSIVESLHEYLRFLNVRVDIEDLKKILSSDRSVLLLDSIDEGLAVYNNLVKSITRFVNDYPNCQVITSSRVHVLKGVSIPFCQVSLLPFNREQLNLFIEKWFNGQQEACQEIGKHLDRNKQLQKVVTNPLSATILCVLFENTVPLPKTESALYHTRLELLAGKFDKEKKFSRLANTPSLIVEQAKILGFEMHLKKVRDADKSFILETLSCEKSDGKSLLNDFLLSEIMVRVSSERFSFGHLRFQEFLASEEIKNRRSFPTDRLLRDPWWNGPLILYCQNSREVDWVFNHAMVNDYVFEVSETLRAIVDVRPADEESRLLSIINTSLVHSERREFAEEFDDEYQDVF